MHNLLLNLQIYFRGLFEILSRRHGYTYVNHGFVGSNSVNTLVTIVHHNDRSFTARCPSSLNHRRITIFISSDVLNQLSRRRKLWPLKLIIFFCVTSTELALCQSIIVFLGEVFPPPNTSPAHRVQLCRNLHC